MDVVQLEVQVLCVPWGWLGLKAREVCAMTCDARVREDGRDVHGGGLGMGISWVRVTTEDGAPWSGCGMRAVLRAGLR